MRAELAGLCLSDPVESWAALGFELAGRDVWLGRVRIRLGEPGRGIVGWALRGVEKDEIDGLATEVGWALGGVEEGEIDGLATEVRGAGGVDAARQPVGGHGAVAGAGDAAVTGGRDAAVTHPNGALGLDHVVVASPDFDRTAAALDAAGLPLRRIRDTGSVRQGFRRLGPAILELVEARDAPPGPARFWGLVVVVADLDALARDLGDRLGPVHDAVQLGRRIATLRPSAGLGQAVAFMDPEVPSGGGR